MLEEASLDTVGVSEDRHRSPQHCWCPFDFPSNTIQKGSDSHFQKLLGGTFKMRSLRSMSGSFHLFSCFLVRCDGTCRASVFAARSPGWAPSGVARRCGSCRWPAPRRRPGFHLAQLRPWGSRPRQQGASKARLLQHTLLNHQTVDPNLWAFQLGFCRK